MRNSVQLRAANAALDERATMRVLAFDELRDEMDCHLIGDARSPRDVQVAIAEGHRVARGLLG